MKGNTALLLAGAALALAACSGGGEGNDVAANAAMENESANSVANDLGVEAVSADPAPAAPAAPDATSAPDAAAEESPQPERKAEPRPERPRQATPPPATEEPAPPPKVECAPEHRAAGHC